MSVKSNELFNFFSYAYLFSDMEDIRMVSFLEGLVDGLYVAEHEDRQWWIDVFYAACELRERRYE